MANKIRHLYGDDQPILVPVESATVIEIGDCVLLSSDYAIQASDLADAGDAAANREACADIFIGIAESASASGETELVRVGTAGVWLLTQKTAASINVGDAVEMYASADHCEDQTIVEGSTSPIGFCIEEDTTGGDIKVKLMPTLLNTFNA